MPSIDLKNEAKSDNYDQLMLDDIRKEVGKELNKINNKLKSNEFMGGDVFSNAILSGHNLKYKKKLDSIYETPFFGRINFTTAESNEESYYIGRYDYESKIISQNSKVAKLFYQKKIGPTDHETLGKVVIDLIRQFEVKDGKIINSYDLTSDTVEYIDPILQKRLEEGASAELKDVVETIQSEQYKVINSNENIPLIVQGSAGSGKTTIALQRISYHLYNNSKLNASKIVIFGPNKMFLGYMKNALPDINIEGIKQTTFTDFWNENVNNTSKDKYKIIYSEEIIASMLTSNHDTKLRVYRRNRLKGSLVFNKLITNYLKDIDNQFNPARYSKELEKFDVQLKNQIKMMNERYFPNTDKLDNNLFENLEERLDRLYRRYSYLPLLKKRHRVIDIFKNNNKDFIKTLSRRVDDLVRNMYSSEFTEVNRAKKSLEKLAGNFIEELMGIWKPIDSFECYFQLITNANNINRYLQKEIRNISLEDFAEDNQKLFSKRYLEASDLAGIYIIDDYFSNGYLSQNKTKIYEYSIVDEAQDYNPLELYILGKIVRKGSITFLGDLGQSIYDFRSIKSWSELNESIIASSDLEPNYEELGLTYRSTKQITTYANQLIKDWAKDKYTLSTPYGRDGDEPIIDNKSTSKEMRLTKVKEYIRAMKTKGHANIAVIVKDSESANRLMKSLKDIHDLKLITNKNSDYRGGVVILPVMLSKGLEFDSVIICNSNEYNINLNDFERKLLYVAVTRAQHDLIVL